MEKTDYKPRIIDNKIAEYLKPSVLYVLKGLNGAGRRGLHHFTATVKYLSAVLRVTFRTENLPRCHRRLCWKAKLRV